MKKIYYLTILSITFFNLTLIGCKKYLDAKPDKKLAVPSTISDLQALMDNYTRLNIREPIAGEISSGDFYVNTTDWLSLVSQEDKRMYIWEKDKLFPDIGNSWSIFSEVVYFSNTVLESLEKIPRNMSNSIDYDNLKGQALFFRAKSLLQASYIWTPAYDPTTAKTDLGMPLRLNTDFNVPSMRASVRATYDQILNDIKASIPLLSLKPLHVMRPSKPASYALLARTYLSMREYSLAGKFADSCLKLSGALIDYNQLDSNSAYPIKRFNDEVIMETMIPGTQILNSPRAKIVKELYQLYGKNDLRRVMFFKKSGADILYKGSYEGGIAFFGGMATDEIYLIRAECRAREGKIGEAMEDINTLLTKRWKAGSYVPIAPTSQNEVLQIILLERRKELLMRGIRWPDIKRLNKEGAEIELVREINNVTYKLVANDLRFALPIPENLLNLTNMAQNPR